MFRISSGYLAKDPTMSRVILHPLLLLLLLLLFVMIYKYDAAKIFPLRSV